MTGAASRVDTATVLFTDVVGSTSQRARIGEEAADRLRNAHDMFVRAAIETNRGTVVKHTGDGVMATFSAAVDAVAAGVAIQQAVDLHNRRGETERIVVRIGISVGDVTFEGDDCFGLPVVEAQRLEAAADGGKILCADIVRHLARGRGGHEFVVHGDLELKGIPGTVPTAEVRWEPLAEVATGAVEGAPLPPALASPSAFPLSGRSEIFERLVTEWKESATGSRRVVLLAGEPGVGKTRLATEVALVARGSGRAGPRRAVRRGPRPRVPAVRRGVAVPARAAPTTSRPPVGSVPPPASSTRLVPEVADRMPGAAPTRADAEYRAGPPVRGGHRLAARHRGRGAGARSCSTTCTGPTHRRSRCCVTSCTRPRTTGSWCSAPTATPTSTARIRSPGALADLRRLGSVQRIAIDGLDRDGVAQLLSRAAGHELDDAGLALADAIYAETTGNPFFVGEIVRNLVESGALVVRDGRWTSDLTLADVGLPEGVREVVGRRISRLDDDTQRCPLGRGGDRRGVRRAGAGRRHRHRRGRRARPTRSRPGDRTRERGRARPVPLRSRARAHHAARGAHDHPPHPDPPQGRGGDRGPPRRNPAKVLTELAFHFGEAAAAGRGRQGGGLRDACR